MFKGVASISVVDECMKTRKKRSRIWQLPDDEFKELVQKSKTITEIINFFGFASCGGTFRTVQKRIKQLSIDVSHIALGIHHNRGRVFPKTRVPLKEVMVENSTYNRCHLKKRLIDDKVLPNECSICKCQPVWNNKPLVLVLDHKNGKRNDNRLENLRLLCPNCNSQEPTFSGRNKKY